MRWWWEFPLNIISTAGIQDLHLALFPWKLHSLKSIWELHCDFRTFKRDNIVPIKQPPTPFHNSNLQFITPFYQYVFSAPLIHKMKLFSLLCLAISIFIENVLTSNFLSEFQQTWCTNLEKFLSTFPEANNGYWI